MKKQNKKSIFFQELYDLEHAGPSGYDRNTLEAFLRLSGAGVGGRGAKVLYVLQYICTYSHVVYTVCYFTGIFYAVVRHISVLFIDNKDCVFCKELRRW